MTIKEHIVKYEETDNGKTGVDRIKYTRVIEYGEDIVRCGQCKYYEDTKGCLLEDNSTRQADDFCSYGERRE